MVECRGIVENHANDDEVINVDSVMMGTYTKWLFTAKVAFGYGLKDVGHHGSSIWGWLAVSERLGLSVL